MKIADTKFECVTCSPKLDLHLHVRKMNNELKIQKVVTATHTTISIYEH